MSEASGAAGEGFATVSRNGIVLNAWLLKRALANGVAAQTRQVPTDGPGYARTDSIRRVEVVPIRTEIASLQDAPVDVHDADVRLHLLSHRLTRPNTVNLDALGPCALDNLQLRSRRV